MNVGGPKNVAAGSSRVRHGPCGDEMVFSIRACFLRAAVSVFIRSVVVCLVMITLPHFDKAISKRLLPVILKYRAREVE